MHRSCCMEWDSVRHTAERRLQLMGKGALGRKQLTTQGRWMLITQRQCWIRFVSVSWMYHKYNYSKNTILYQVVGWIALCVWPHPKKTPRKQNCGGVDGNPQQAVPEYLSSFIIFFEKRCWMSMWRYVYMNAGTWGDQKVASGSLELELQDAMSCWRWVLRPKLLQE